MGEQEGLLEVYGVAGAKGEEDGEEGNQGDGEGCGPAEFFGGGDAADDEGDGGEDEE